MRVTLLLLFGVLSLLHATTPFQSLLKSNPEASSQLNDTLLRYSETITHLNPQHYYNYISAYSMSAITGLMHVASDACQAYLYSELYTPCADGQQLALDSFSTMRNASTMIIRDLATYYSELAALHLLKDSLKDRPEATGSVLKLPTSVYNAFTKKQQELFESIDYSFDTLSKVSSHNKKVTNATTNSTVSYFYERATNYTILSGLDSFKKILTEVQSTPYGLLDSSYLISYFYGSSQLTIPEVSANNFTVSSDPDVTYIDLDSYNELVDYVITSAIGNVSSFIANMKAENRVSTPEELKDAYIAATYTYIYTYLPENISGVDNSQDYNTPTLMYCTSEAARKNCNSSTLSALYNDSNSIYTPIEIYEAIEPTLKGYFANLTETPAFHSVSNQTALVQYDEEYLSGLIKTYTDLYNMLNSYNIVLSNLYIAAFCSICETSVFATEFQVSESTLNSINTAKSTLIDNLSEYLSGNQYFSANSEIMINFQITFNLLSPLTQVGIALASHSVAENKQSLTTLLEHAGYDLISFVGVIEYLDFMSYWPKWSVNNTSFYQGFNLVTSSDTTPTEFDESYNRFIQLNGVSQTKYSPNPNTKNFNPPGVFETEDHKAHFETEDHKGLSGGKIAAAVIFSILGAIIIVVAVYFAFRKKPSKNTNLT